MDREFDRYTVDGLRALSRNRGLKRYSRLRRNELITLLINTGPSILDRDIGTTNDPVLIPTIASPLPSTLKVHTVIYEPLNAGGWIPLPDWIVNKKACINMKSKNDECFTDCILRHLNPTDSHPERVDGNLKSKKNSLNMKGIKYPVSLLDIDKFERQNREISVNVYEYTDKKKIRRIRAIKSLRENHVNLLYIEDGEKSHYVLIKNFNALMREQVSGNHNVEYCMLCNGHFEVKNF